MIRVANRNYTIVSGYKDAVEEEVNKLLEEGYELAGNLAYSDGAYVQPMMKPEVVTEEINVEGIQMKSVMDTDINLNEQ